MKRKLIFIGGGDFCRELYWTATCIAPNDRDWEPFGVIDETPVKAAEHLGRRGFALPVIGAISDFQPREDEVFIPAIGNPFHKLRLCDLLAGRGAEFANVIHPTCAIAPDAQLGKGIFCFLNSVISVGAIIGDYVSLNVAAVVGHDATVARGCTLCPGSVVCGNVGLEQGAYLGTDATIAPKLTMGEFAALGAGSVALTSVGAGSTVMGVPARAVAPPRNHNSK